MDTYRPMPAHVVNRPPYKPDGVLRARHPLRHAGKDYAPGDWMGTAAELGWDARLVRIHHEQMKVDTYGALEAIDAGYAQPQALTNAALATLPPLMTQPEAKQVRAALKRR